ncbi:MAG: alpha-mannosidase [bacterium]|nr:alpha-mannosidase [bacterium]
MPTYEAQRKVLAEQIRIRLSEIRSTIYSHREPIRSLRACITGPGKGPEAPPASGWEAFEARCSWGGFDQTTWFKMRATVPKSMRGHRVVALVRPGGESLAYVNEEPVQGLDNNRDMLLLVERAKGGEKFDILLESVPSTQHDTHHAFQYADLAVMHQDVWDFYWDLHTAMQAWELLPQNFAPQRQLLDLLNRCAKMVDALPRDEPAYYESIALAQKALRQGLKTFEQSHGMGHLTLTGHSHIDTAWLWPKRETQRKCGRTFSTVLALMDRYPEYHFSCSQPAQYAWLKEQRPELYDKIRRHVRGGRWEPNGCFWVEPDLNVPSGESLVRQAVYGNRFFREEFGLHSRVAWTPDTFGYCWTLPQILRRAQVDFFVTGKLYWNQFTAFPHSHFMWEGTDGSRIRSVLPDNYNGDPEPRQILSQWDNNKQKELAEEFLFPFGYGDGGGGPTAEMIERGKRLKNVIGLPKCEFGKVQDALDRMAKQCPAEQLPVWNGELYFELHRGCQTSQARTKRNNRKCEYALRDAEFLSALSLLHGGTYDADTLYNAWTMVLTNQFHDILPGTSINEVYATADEEYAQVLEQLARVRSGAVSHVSDQIDTSGEGQAVVVFNSLSWVRTDVASVRLDNEDGPVRAVSPDGTDVPCQRGADGALVFEARDVPPLGYAVYRVLQGEAEHPAESTLAASPSEMENDCIRVTFDAMGRLSSVYDKTEEREVLPEGTAANTIQLFEDRPSCWEAWDIDYDFEEKMWEPGAPESIEVIESGPVRAVVRIIRTTDLSTITQDVTLYAGSPRLDFVTHVDWHDRRTLMKAAFPVDVRSDHATFEIQFGALNRPTHANRDADLAQFEVPAQKWADLSEGDYGASLLNDCKYGYDVKDNVLRISLLRAPLEPDKHADEGEHTFTYSLYPHGADWRNGTVQQGLELNVPIIAATARSAEGERPPQGALAAVDAENVIIDTVKRAEDSDDIIVRLYEAYGQRGPVMLTLDRPPRKVTECDLMEENDTPVDVQGANVRFTIKPFEIRTFKVRF